MNRQNRLAIWLTCLSSLHAVAQEPQIQEISVLGQFVPDEKRSTGSISNVLNAEEFQRTGDANIAESLKLA